MSNTNQFPVLEYRGNYQVTVGIDYGNSFLGADFGGGFSETERIFPGLLFARLNYSALLRNVRVELPGRQYTDCLSYFWNFYRDSMDAGRRPFCMRSPLDGKLYLWEFTDDSLELTLVDRFLATTGVAVRQAYVRGLTTLAGGILDETEDD